MLVDEAYLFDARSENGAGSPAAGEENEPRTYVIYTRG
jgi:hypothetical protein